MISLMGIKGIKSILPDPKIIEPQEYASKKIAVDTSIYLYKYVYGYGPEKFIDGFKQLVNNWKNSVLIFIFDGPPPELKKKVIEKRKENTEKISITKEMIQDLKDFFVSKDIEFIVAEGEAEKTAAIKNKNNEVDAVMTNDLDAFLFGGLKVIRNLKGTEYAEYNISIILEELGISFQQFLEVCIACGTDYHPEGIKRFGPKKSLKYIKENETLEKLFTEEHFLAMEEFKK